MIDKTTYEAEALMVAGAEGGAYIEAIMKAGASSDFATWTPEQYHTFIECVVTAFVENLQKIVNNEEVPF